MQLLKVLLVVLLAVNLSTGFFFKKKKVYVHHSAPAPVYRHAYSAPPPAPVYRYQSYHQPPAVAPGYASYYNQPVATSYHAAPAYPVAAPHPAPAYSAPAPAPAPAYAPYPPSSVPASHYSAPAPAPVAPAFNPPTPLVNPPPKPAPVKPALVPAAPVLTPVKVPVQAPAAPKRIPAAPVLTPVKVPVQAPAAPKRIPAAPVLTPVKVPVQAPAAPKLIPAAPVLTPVEVPVLAPAAPKLIPATPVLTPVEIPVQAPPSIPVVLNAPVQTEVVVGTNVISNAQNLPVFEPAIFQSPAKRLGGEYTVVPSIGTDLIPSVSQGGSQGSSQFSTSVEIVPSMLIQSGRVTDSMEVIRSVGYELPPETVRIDDEAVRSADNGAVSFVMTTQLDGVVPNADINLAPPAFKGAGKGGDVTSATDVNLALPAFNGAGNGGDVTSATDVNLVQPVFNNAKSGGAVNLEALDFNAPSAVSGGDMVSVPLSANNNYNPVANYRSESESDSTSTEDEEGVDFVDNVLAANRPADNSDGLSFSQVEQTESSEESNPTLDSSFEDSSSNNEEAKRFVQVDKSNLKVPIGRKAIQTKGEVRPPPNGAAQSEEFDTEQDNEVSLRLSDSIEDTDLDPISLPEVQEFLKELGNDQQTVKDARSKKHIVPGLNLQVFKSVEIDPHVSYSRVARQ